MTVNHTQPQLVAADWPVCWPRVGRLFRCTVAEQPPTPDTCQALGLALIKAANKRQTQWFAGRCCALAGLRALGSDQTLQPGSDGAPLWPAGFVGSISHSQTLAAAIVSRRADQLSLGLDLEAPLAQERAFKLVKAILTPNERARLQGLNDAQQALAIGWSFSLKESLFKALYPLTGVHFYFQDAECLSPPAQGPVRMRLLKTLTPDWPAGQLLTGYCDYLQGFLATLLPVTAPAAEYAATAD